jgi:DNA segregation ATPase FtsK/SpoIIIE-like protein
MPSDFKTLQFPNTPRGQEEKVRALRKESAAGWEVVSESVTAGKFKSGDACCLFLICAPCAFFAGHTKGEITVTLRRTTGQGVGNTSPRIVEGIIDRDSLLRDAAECVIANGYGNTAILQRQLKVGYGRASRLIEELEAAGIVERGYGSEKRKVLASREDLDRIIGAA